ncbi:MAG: AAA family ATPase [Balneolaceae bacterium]|nr:AAA family ATPase [Balneolaceae bacterium]
MMKNSTRPVLYIFSGLPGAGKTKLAKMLCRHSDAFYLRIDTIEQQLRESFAAGITVEGYRLAYRLAAENLELGKSVIADSCNPVRQSRIEWQQTAKQSGADFVNIEIICSSVTEHRRRIESRQGDIPGLNLPSWADVENREYHRWNSDRIIVDTAGRTADQSFQQLLQKLGLKE